MKIPKVQNHILGESLKNAQGHVEIIPITGDSIMDLAGHLRGHRFQDIQLTVTITSGQDLKDMGTLLKYIRGCTTIMGDLHYNDAKKRQDEKKEE